MFIVLGHWFLSFSSMPVFASFQFFASSNVLLSSFHFTLLYFNASRFLPLSFHVRYLPCPSIVWSYPFIVPPCHVQNLTDRIFGMHDRGHHGGHNLCVNIGKIKYTHIQKHVLSCSCHFLFISAHIPFMRFYSPVSFLSLPSMFLPFPSIISHIFVLRLI